MAQNAGPFVGKRVLVVTQHFWPENFRINDIVEGFVQHGMQVDVLCGLPNYPAGRLFEGYRYTGPRHQQYQGAEVYRAGEIPRKGNTGLRIFLNYVSFPMAALFNLPRLHGKKYHAVFCYCTSPVLMMLPAVVYAKIHRLPLTTYVLDLWPDNLYSVLPVKNKLLRTIAQGVSNWFYRRSNRLIAMSSLLEQKLRQVTAGTKKSIEYAVIPQYCEDFYAAQVHDAVLAAQYSGKFTILFTGNISPAQDLENLVEAVKLAAQQGCTNLQCLIVGDGMSCEVLQQTIREAGVEGYFTFPGSCQPQEIPAWTGIADALFAGLSKSANLGLTVPAKITSYLAAGKPLLVAADGEAARVSQQSGAALVSPAGDSAALAANIVALYNMPVQQRAVLGDAGRTCYRQQYSRALLLQQLEHFIINGN